MMIFPPSAPIMFDPRASGITAFHPAAKPLFDQARRQANVRHLLASLMGQPRQLQSLAEADQVALQFNAQPSQTSLLISQITGTINRAQEFDRDFLPLSDTLETRWVRVASMMLQGRSLPPVELIRVGQAYYVVDGHHRISVSRMLHRNFIDAVIRNDLRKTASPGQLAENAPRRSTAEGLFTSMSPRSPFCISLE